MNLFNLAEIVQIPSVLDVQLIPSLNFGQILNRMYLFLLSKTSKFQKPLKISKVKTNLQPLS